MNVLEYAQSKGLSPKWGANTNNGEYKGPCLLCGEGDDRCAYSPNKPGQEQKGGGYYCRICGVSGDLIDLIRKFERVSYREACEIAGVRAKALKNTHYSNPSISLSATEKLKVAAVSGGKLWAQKANAFVDWSHGQLLKTKTAIDWLLSARLLNLETIERFKIGWNPQDIYSHRQCWGLQEKLNENGRPKQILLPRGLVIPRYSATGNLVGLKVRRPDENLKNKNDSRYLIIPGGSPALAFYGTIKTAFLLVESELDAILVYQYAGDLLATVSTGSASANCDSASYEALSLAQKVLISLDSDTAGKNGLRKWYDLLSNSKDWCISSKRGKDHTEAAFKGYPIRQWVENGLRLAPGTIDYSGQRETQITNTAPKSRSIQIDVPVSGYCASEDDNALILEAVKLQSEAEESGREEIVFELKRALNTVDFAGKNQESYQFAIKVLRAAVDDVKLYSPVTAMTPDS